MSQKTEHPELHAFPPTIANKQRFVIVLPTKERVEENAFSVELLSGKIMLTDGINNVRLSSTIEAVSLKGWGYTYYEIVGKDTVMSTKMVASKGKEMTETFVAGGSITIDYNSRLPIVIYAPKEHEIRYRIWRADDSFTTAKQA